jgi:hypothetical protein
VFVEQPLALPGSAKNGGGGISFKYMVGLSQVDFKKVTIMQEEKKNLGFL